MYAVRHGQRADDPCCNDSLSIELEFDPPLSKHGIAQAHVSGKYLKEAIANLERISGETKKIIILSSPFLRCIQTAIFLSNSLDNFHKNTIYINDEISEIQKSKFFSKNVLQDLHVRKSISRKSLCDLSYARKISIKEKKFFNKSGSTINFAKNELLFPETISDCSSRFRRARKNITEKFLRNNFAKNIVILITHGIGVQCMIHELEPEKEIPQIDYCAMTQINSQWDAGRKEVFSEIALKNYNEHVKIKIRDENQ